MKKIIQQYGLSILVAATILYLSLSPGTGWPSADDWGFHFKGFDKLVHGLMYVGFALVLTFDLSRKQATAPPASFSRRKLVLIAIFLPILYGGLMEILQPYFPPRTAEWADFLADTIGSLVGFACMDIAWRHKLSKLCKKKHSSNM